MKESSFKPLVSIIIPVYNVESFLNQCLESVDNQTYENFEIILVDDESTDNSGKLCDSYAIDRKNVKVVHQKNMGLSGARNSGFSVSTGDYITFIDSDDVITDDYIEILVDGLKDGTADISVATIMKFYNDIPNIDKNTFDVEMMDPESALKALCNQTKFGNSACAKLYKRNLIERYPYPVGRLYEDLMTTHKIIGDAKHIAYSSRVIYFYRQRIDSIVNHSEISKKDLDALEAARIQLNYIEATYPGAKYAAEGRCVVAGFDLIRLLTKPTLKNKAYFKEIHKYVKPYKKDVIHSSDVNFKTKIKCRFICAGYYPAIICSLIFKFLRTKVNG